MNKILDKASGALFSSRGRSGKDVKMLNKMLSLTLVVMILCALAPLSVRAELSEIMVYNNTSSISSETRFTVGATGASFDNVINVKNSSQTVLDSKHTGKGYNGTTPIALSAAENIARYYFWSSNTPEDAGWYDVYFYNICEGVELRRNSTTTYTTPDYHVRYSVAGVNGETRYYIDQSTASGGESGWVKLGTHAFSGGSSERLEIRKIFAGNSYAYLSAAKLVPVSRPDSAKLMNMFTKSDGNKIELEASKIESNIFCRQIPNAYADKTLELCFEAEDSGASIEVLGHDLSPLATGTGKAVYSYMATPGIEYFTVNVTSANGQSDETYKVSVDVDGAAQLGGYAVWDGATDPNDHLVTSDGPFSYDRVSTAGIDKADANYAMPPELAAMCDITLQRRVKLAVIGDTVTWTPDFTKMSDEKAGYYNVYIWSAGNAAYFNDKIGTVVTHNGLREERTIDSGKYHKLDARWVFAGKYYFNGDGTETVSCVKIADGTRDSIIAGMKLVKSEEDLNVNAFRGISIKAGDSVISVTRDMFTNGNYYQPLPSGDYSDVPIRVVSGGAEYEYLKINSTDTMKNIPVNVPVNAAGETTVKVELKSLGYDAETYELTLFKETTVNSVSKRVEATGTDFPALTFPATNAYARNLRMGTTPGVSATFAATLPKVGAYKLLVWKPAFDLVYNAESTQGKGYSNPNQAVKINTGYGTHDLTVDWTGATSQWVDLGTYMFAASPSVVFTVGDYPVMLDVAKFHEMPAKDGLSGVSVDGAYIAANEINTRNLNVSGGYLNIIPFADGESDIYINGQLVISGSDLSVPLNLGINKIKIKVLEGGSSSDVTEYVLTATKTESIIYQDDHTAAVINAENTGVADGLPGYDGSETIYIADGNVKFNLNQTGITAKGKTEVWVYRIEGSEGVSESVAAKIAATGETVTKHFSNYTGDESGWVSLGTYDFSGIDSEYIEISTSEIALVNCVKLVNDEDYIISTPVIKINGSDVSALANGNASAEVYIYKKTETQMPISLLFAVYDKTNHSLEGIKIDSVNTTDAGNITLSTDTVEVTDYSNTYVSAYVWDDRNSIIPMAPHHSLNK